MVEAVKLAMRMIARDSNINPSLRKHYEDALQIDEAEQIANKGVNNEKAK